MMDARKVAQYRRQCALVKEAIEVLSCEFLKNSLKLGELRAVLEKMGRELGVVDPRRLPQDTENAE